MKALFITPLSRLQILLYTTLTLALITGGVFISSSGFRQTAYVAGSCLFPDEIDELVAQKSSLESQAASLQVEIEQTQANIVNDSSFVSTTIMRIAELQSGILSDYALYLEEQNLNQVCSQSSGDSSFSCSNIGDSYNCANTQGCLWGGGTSAYCYVDQNISCNGNDQSACEQYSGCGWGLIGGYWAGTPSVSCDGSGQSTCERYSGCSWMATENGGSCSGTPYGVSCDQAQGDPGCTWVQGAGYACSGVSNVSCSGSDSSSCTSVGGCNWTEGTPDSCYNDPNASQTTSSSSCSDATTAYNNLVADNNTKKTELASLESGTQTDTNLTTELDQKNALLSDITVNQIPAITQALALSTCPTDETNGGQDPSACSDGVDNDRNGPTDCEDNACSSNPECQGTTETCWDSSACNPGASGACEYDSCRTDGGGGEVGLVPEICGNGVDDDGNGSTDCDDVACSDTRACLPPETACQDGVDNDKDGAVDCADGDCVNDSACKSIEDTVSGISCEEEADEALKNCLASIDPGDPNASNLAGSCQAQKSAACAPATQCKAPTGGSCSVCFYDPSHPAFAKACAGYKVSKAKSTLPDTSDVKAVCGESARDITIGIAQHGCPSSADIIILTTEVLTYHYLPDSISMYHMGCAVFNNPLGGIFSKGVAEKAAEKMKNDLVNDKIPVLATITANQQPAVLISKTFTFEGQTYTPESMFFGTQSQYSFQVSVTGEQKCVDGSFRYSNMKGTLSKNAFSCPSVGEMCGTSDGLSNKVYCGSSGDIKMRCEGPYSSTESLQGALIGTFDK